MGICITKPDEGNGIGEQMKKANGYGPTTSKTELVHGDLANFMNTLPRTFFNIKGQQTGEVNSEEGSPKLYENYFLCSLSVGPVELNGKKNRVLYFRAVETSKRTFFEKELDTIDIEGIKNAIDPEGSITWRHFFQTLETTLNLQNVSIEPVPQTTEGDLSKAALRVNLNFKGHGTHALNISLHEVRDQNDEAIEESFFRPLYQFYSMHAERKKASRRLEDLQRELRLLKEKAHELENGITNVNAVKSLRSLKNEKKSSLSLQRKDSVIFKGEEIDLANFPGDHVLTFLKEIKKRLVQLDALSGPDMESFNQVLNTIAFDSLFKARLNETQIRKEMQADEQILTWLKRKFAVKDEVKREMSTLAKDLDSKEFRQRLDTDSSNRDEKTRQSIMEMFDRLDEWGFDVFTLDELTEGHTLFITGYTIFLRYDLINKFNIDEKVLINFLKEVEAGYHPNPYHNAMHAADVTQAMHYIITKGGLMQYMTDEDVFAAVFAGLVHDLDHPGLNNAFQVTAQSYLSTLYNDQSVLENHHCSQAFELCRDPKYNIFKNVSSEQYRDIRSTAIDLILATDMSLHGAVFGRFKSRIEADADFTSKEDVRLALQIAIKMADVSNPTRPETLYLKWTERINDEFFKQGDKERDCDMPISPMMDRSKASIGKGQIAFMNYIVQPMFECCAQLLPDMQFTVDCVASNRQYWMDKEAP